MASGMANLSRWNRRAESNIVAVAGQYTSGNEGATRKEEGRSGRRRSRRETGKGARPHQVGRCGETCQGCSDSQEGGGAASRPELKKKGGDVDPLLAARFGTICLGIRDFGILQPLSGLAEPPTQRGQHRRDRLCCCAFCWPTLAECCFTERVRHGSVPVRHGDLQMGSGGGRVEGQGSRHMQTVRYGGSEDYFQRRGNKMPATGVDKSFPRGHGGAVRTRQARRGRDRSGRTRAGDFRPGKSWPR